MQKENSQVRSILITGICFFAFFLFGFIDNLKGPTLPFMLEELKIDYVTGANIFSGAYFGFLIATMMTGIIADRLGLKSVLVFAGVCLFLGVAGYSTFQAPLWLALSLFILGLGFGAFELGPNAIIVGIHKERKGLFLNLMSVMHGLGSFLVPLFANWLFALGLSWRSVYRWDLLPIALFLILTLLLRFPKTEETAQIDFRQIPKIAFIKNLPLFYAAIALYVAAEIGIAAWLVTYLQEIKNVTVDASNLSLSLFFAMLMIGRLIGGFFVHRLGYIKSVLFAALGSVICLSLGTFTSLTIFLPITGLFFSITFPTITAEVSDSFTENANTILGTLFTFAGIGSLIGPWLVGWASTSFGLQNGFSLNLFFAICLLITTFFLAKGLKNGQSS